MPSGAFFVWYNRVMVILFGLAGTGKSTHGQLLAEKHQMRWLSVGQVLRDTGQFTEVLERGELVDDDVVIKLMSKKIREIRDGGEDIILDGFPRDKYQAEWVAKNLAGEIEKAALIEVPKEELVARLMERGRADDTREAIIKRFEITEQNICSILEILGDKGVEIVKVNGQGTIEETNAKLEAALFPAWKLPEFMR